MLSSQRQDATRSIPDYKNLPIENLIKIAQDFLTENSCSSTRLYFGCEIKNAIVYSGHASEKERQQNKDKWRQLMLTKQIRYLLGEKYFYHFWGDIKDIHGKGKEFFEETIKENTKTLSYQSKIEFFYRITSDENTNSNLKKFLQDSATYSALSTEDIKQVIETALELNPSLSVMALEAHYAFLNGVTPKLLVLDERSKLNAHENNTTAGFALNEIVAINEAFYLARKKVLTSPKESAVNFEKAKKASINQAFLDFKLAKLVSLTKSGAAKIIVDTYPNNQPEAEKALAGLVYLIDNKFAIFTAPRTKENLTGAKSEKDIKHKIITLAFISLNFQLHEQYPQLSNHSFDKEKREINYREVLDHVNVYSSITPEKVLTALKICKNRIENYGDNLGLFTKIKHTTKLNNFIRLISLRCAETSADFAANCNTITPFSGVPSIQYSVSTKHQNDNLSPGKTSSTNRNN